jgi:hypothetical protein
MGLKYLSIYVGSLNCYKVSILLKDSSGDVFVLDTLNAFSLGFNWQDITSYHAITYETTADNLEYSAIVKVGLAKEGIFHPSRRDEKVNSDEWSITGIKPLD